MASKRRKGRKSSRKRAHKSNPTTSHKKGRKGKRRHKRNPFGSVSSSIKSLQSPVVKGLGIAAGALVVGVIAQNVVPSKYREGTLGPIVTGAVALGAAYLASRVSALKKYSGEIAVGGVAAAILSAVAQPVLSATQFNLLGESDRRRLYLPSRTVGELDTRRIVRGNRSVPAGLPA